MNPSTVVSSQLSLSRLPKCAAVNSNLLTPTTLGFRLHHRKWELRKLMESLTSLHRPTLPASVAFLRGRTVHDLIIKNSFDSELFLINNLLSVYVMCGGMAEALRLFQGMTKKNVISWTSIISGFAQLGLGEKAFDLFFQMQEAGIKPNQWNTLGNRMSLSVRPSSECTVIATSCIT